MVIIRFHTLACNIKTLAFNETCFSAPIRRTKESNLKSLKFIDRKLNLHLAEKLQTANSRCASTFNTGEGLIWQQLKTSHFESHPGAFDRCEPVWTCLESLVKGQIEKKEEPGAWGGRAIATGCSPHTSFRGQRWAHGPLPSVESSLCFASVCLRLMNRLLATVGLCVWRLRQKIRREKRDIIKSKSLREQCHSAQECMKPPKRMWVNLFHVLEVYIHLYFLLNSK